MIENIEAAELRAQLAECQRIISAQAETIAAANKDAANHKTHNEMMVLRARKAEDELLQARGEIMRQGLDTTPHLAEDAASRDVLVERRRQVSAEGWTPEHDDEHGNGELAGAAACYAVSDITHWARHHILQTLWPWAPEWWKPSGRRRNLVKAGALILAEIERLDRTAIQRGAQS